LAISTAGIHATVISILIGLGIAFVLHINTQLREVETDALKIAEGVNHIRFSPAWFKLISPSSKFLENWSSQDDQIQAWLTSYWIDPTGKHTIDNSLDRPPFKVYFSDLGLNHTEFKLCLMGALVLRSPFPERMVIKNGKHVGLQPTPTVAFSNIRELKDWKLLVDKKFRVIAGNINWFGVEPFTQGFDWNKEIRLHYKFWKNDPKGYSPETLRQFRKLPKEFCLNVESIYDISQTLDYKLRRLDYLQKVNPSKVIVLLTLFGSIVTFLFGVIIPVMHPKASRFLVVSIPTAFYLYFVVYLAIKVFTIIQET
jgi:hypothetical protein